MTRRQPVVFSLVLGFVLSIVLACRAREDTSATPPEIAPRQQRVALRLGYIPVADCGQLFIALDRGFFNSQGLDIQLVSMPGGSKILEALGAGSLDVGFSNVVSLILAHDAGLPFVALTGGPVEDAEHKEHAILVSASSSVAGIGNLEGKKIALNTRRNIDELMVTLILKKNNVPPQNVRFVEMPFPRMISAIEKGDIDAAASIEPYVTIGLASGAKVITYNYVDVQPTTEISTYVGSRDWIGQNPNVAQRFTRALRDATDFANHNPDIVRRVVAKYTSIDPKYVDKVILPGFTSKLSEQGLQSFITRARELGWIEKEFPARDLFTE